MVYEDQRCHCSLIGKRVVKLVGEVAQVDDNLLERCLTNRERRDVKG